MRTRWIDRYYAGRSDTYKNIAITTVKAAMNWAVEQGYLDHSPIARIRKPRAAVREFYLPVSEWRRVLKVCRGQAFSDFVTVLLLTGARPQELRIVEARHYDVPASRLVFSIRESKGKLRRRVIYLDDTARAIAERLIAKYPTGPLFRNSRGRRWTSDSINSRFRRLKARLNMPELCAYALRHSFAHWKLTSDTDSHLVAKLLGHTDGRMLHTRYGHVDDDADFMLNAVLATRSPLGDQCHEMPGKQS